MVVTRRSSQRLLKKAKLESTSQDVKQEQPADPMDLDTTEFSVVKSDDDDDDDDDFQEPESVSVRIRALRTQQTAVRSAEPSGSRIDAIKRQESYSESSNSRKRVLRSRSNTPASFLEEDDTADEELLDNNSAVASPSATPLSLTEFDSGSQQVSIQGDDPVAEPSEDEAAIDPILRESSPESEEDIEEVNFRRRISNRTPHVNSAFFRVCLLIFCVVPQDTGENQRKAQRITQCLGNT